MRVDEENTTQSCESLNEKMGVTLFEPSYPINEGCHMCNVLLENLDFSALSRNPPKSNSSIPVALRLKKEFNEFDTDNYNFSKTLKIGLCARDSKIFSKPMKEIIARLLHVTYFEIIIIHDDVTNNVDVTHWPIVHVLISFYSHGFLLDKAIEYAELRKPYLPNDLKMQYVLQDRVKIYKLLRQEGIDVPRYSVVYRDATTLQPVGVTVTELDDGIEIDNDQFHRPLVEKPVCADDHNVCIYFPQMMGGGCQRLFRKIGNRSSIYCADAAYRSNGSYIYEEFLATDGTDVKVYSVGLEYAHAEARKSPSLDGIVERDADGKEVRYPVILSAYEKILASKISRIFKQTVCGFDLLRAKGRSCVCDVNGFSFVKKSRKYYDDCASILTGVIARNVDSFFVIPPSVSTMSLSSGEKSENDVSRKSMLEFRCIIAIVRHADRTPKQKMKMVVQHEKFIALFRKYGGNEEARVKLKTPKQLQDVLNVTRELLFDPTRSNNCEFVESPAKLLQMKYVLEMYDKFSGINRKVQLKSLTDDRNAILHYKFKGQHQDFASNRPTLLLVLKWGGELTEAGLKQSEDLGKAYRNLYPSESSRFVQHQRKTLNKSVSNHYGVLRLHSTYRHDLKIYASDEGRVQLTAAAFAKGFLALESSLTSILVHLVSMDKASTLMLDACDDAEFLLQQVKTKLHNMLKADRPLGDDELASLAPTKNQALIEHLKKIKNPKEACEKIHILLGDITRQIRHLQNSYLNSIKSGSASGADLATGSNETVISGDTVGSASGGSVNPTGYLGANNVKVMSSISKHFNLYHHETINLMERRWGKLEKDFKQQDGTYNISLIPDIYDCAKYDYLHNVKLDLQSIQPLFDLSKSFASAVIPLEYGISVQEKLQIGKSVCKLLLKKIKGDLSHVSHQDSTHRLNTDADYDTDIVSPHRHVRSRFYFTSESHIYGIFNTFWYGGLFDESCPQWQNANKRLQHIQEFDFLSQIVIIEYEDPMAPENSPERFHVEFYFSPGCRNKKHDDTTMSTYPGGILLKDSLIDGCNSEDVTLSKSRRASFSSNQKPVKIQKKFRQNTNTNSGGRLNSITSIEQLGQDKLSTFGGIGCCDDDPDKNEYDSDGELPNLRNRFADSTKLSYQLRKPSINELRNANIEVDEIFSADPLLALSNSLTLERVNSFLEKIIS